MKKERMPGHFVLDVSAGPEQRPCLETEQEAAGSGHCLEAGSLSLEAKNGFYSWEKLKSIYFVTPESDMRIRYRCPHSLAGGTGSRELHKKGVLQRSPGGGQQSCASNSALGHERSGHAVRSGGAALRSAELELGREARGLSAAALPGICQVTQGTSLTTVSDELSLPGWREVFIASCLAVSLLLILILP